MRKRWALTLSIVSILVVFGFQNCSGYDTWRTQELAGHISSLSSNAGENSQESNATGDTQLSPSAPSNFSGYDVLILAGQSNAVGGGLGEPGDDATLTAYDSKIFQVGRWGSENMQVVAAKEPLQNWDVDESFPGKGLTMAFARRYARHYLEPGRALIIVPAARGSTSIRHWSHVADSPYVETILYNDMKARTQVALNMPNSRLVGVLWHQGEGDMVVFPNKPNDTTDDWYFKIVPSPAGYAARVQKLILAIRADFPTSSCVPFVMGEVVPNWTEGRADLPEIKRQFKDAMIGMANVTPCVGFAESTGLLSNIEELGQETPIHFSARSLAILGARYFDVFKKLRASASTGSGSGGGSSSDDGGSSGKASCANPSGGTPIPHGGSIPFYRQSSVPYGQQCALQSRKCTNGVLSGSGTSTTCTVEKAPAGGGDPVAPTTAIEKYIDIVYLSIFNKKTPAESMAYLKNSYNSGVAGCHAIVRDLMKLDPLRPSASDLSTSKNLTYIRHLYPVAFRRQPMTGDDPNAILSLRKNGYTLEKVEEIFLTHAEFKAICQDAGLRLLPSK